jgi:hypothetical protein
MRVSRFHSVSPWRTAKMRVAIMVLLCLSA